MRKSTALVLFISLVAAIAAAPAAADDARTCDQSKNSDAVIAACSRLIASGRGSRHDRAMNYYSRGEGYADKGDHDRAAVAALANPQRDAQAVAEALRSIGFETVTLQIDVARDKFVDTLRNFAADSEQADWAVIYFAGHGLEVGGANYLIPVDAHLVTDRDVQFQAVSLEQMLAAVEGARKLRLVLLDACRDNPFQLRRTVATRTIGRGLSAVEPGAGTLVAYAAKHGQLALDGQGTNSPFAAGLLKLLKRPGIEVGKLFRLLHDEVMEATGNRQEPYTYGALSGREDFFFVPPQ
jgi:uncharacterized caspase-like protein